MLESRENVVLKLKPGLVVSNTARPARRAARWRGLLWAEWYCHSKLLLLFLGLWLASVWTLSFFSHPLWILALVWAYAMIAGPAYGGMEILDGSEEFMHSLPPRRRDRFIARMLIGGGTVLLFALMSWAALGFDLPQILHQLYVKSGLVKSMPHLQFGLFLGLAVFCPLAVFVFSFVLSSMTHARLLVLTAWFWSLLTVLVLVEAGFYFEEWTEDALAGNAACWFLAAGMVAGVLVGGVRFRKKEIGEKSMPLAIPSNWWLWCALASAGLILASLLLNSLARHSQLMGW